jgi:lipopolysaccharide export system protein LptA
MSVRALSLQARRWRDFGAGLAIAVVVCGSAANAQQNQGPQNALQGFSQNRDQPVRIRSAALEVREKDKLATFSGEVNVINGDTELRCKTLTVFYDDDPRARDAKPAGPARDREPQIRRIEAKGGVTVVQKDQNAVGDAATFNVREDIVTLVGNVIVTRGGTVMRGQRLTVNLTSGVSKMDQGPVDVLIPRLGAEARKP